jgi:hypothetical protein
MIDTFDEVWLVDWNTEEGKPPLLYDIADNVEFQGNLHHIVVAPEAAKVLTRYDVKAQKVCEVLARNIGIRRATGDWIVSTNIDIISPERDTLERKFVTLDKNTFYTLSRRGVSPDRVEKYPFSEWRVARKEFTDSIPERDFPEKTVKEDNYSIINCCGDFQIAHRDTWNEIRGFEESLVGPLSADTNVQKKAVMHGFGLIAMFEPPIFHIDHGKGGGGFLDGISPVCNNPYEAITNANRTKNEDTWGFTQVNIEWEVL